MVKMGRLGLGFFLNKKMKEKLKRKKNIKPYTSSRFYLFELK